MALYGSNYGQPIDVGWQNQGGLKTGQTLTRGDDPLSQANYDLESWLAGPRQQGESMDWGGGKLTFNGDNNGRLQATYVDKAGSQSSIYQGMGTQGLQGLAYSNRGIADQWNNQYGTSMFGRPEWGQGVQQAQPVQQPMQNLGFQPINDAGFNGTITGLQNNPSRLASQGMANWNAANQNNTQVQMPSFNQNPNMTFGANPFVASGWPQNQGLLGGTQFGGQVFKPRNVWGE